MALKRKILVVDDEKDVLEAVRDILEIEGYSVITAEDGKAGTELLRELLPELILTDVVMQDMEGIEFMKAVHRQNKEIPIVVMSGHPVGTKFFKAAELFGAKATLLKPFSKSELLQVIERCIPPYPRTEGN